MEILLGFLLCLFLEGMLWFGVRAWRKTLPPPAPVQPPTAAQLANEAAYDAQQAHHPVVAHLTLRRPVRRGRRARNLEDEYNPFE